MDRRIDNLTGKRKIGFYSWDLECLESFASDLLRIPKDKGVADKNCKKASVITS
ncbi:hypothetical protein BH23THE1_BH23THE1_31450 [soil metagenome]